MKRLVIRLSDLKSILDRLVGARIEQAGFLIGRVEGGEVYVEMVMFGRNVEESPLRFKIDSDDVYRAISEAEKRGLEIVGIFHSHPAPPALSKLDKKGMELWPVIWLVVDSRNGSYAAWDPEGRLVRIIVKD